MSWKSLIGGNFLRNGLLAAIVFMFVVQLGNGGPFVGGLILAAPFGISLLMVQLASAKKTKRLAAISSAIALGGVFFLLATATGHQAGIYVFFGLLILGPLLGLLFILFGIMEWSARSERRLNPTTPRHGRA